MIPGPHRDLDRLDMISRHTILTETHGPLKHTLFQARSYVSIYQSYRQAILHRCRLWPLNAVMKFISGLLLVSSTSRIIVIFWIIQLPQNWVWMWFDIMYHAYCTSVNIKNCCPLAVGIYEGHINSNACTCVRSQLGAEIPVLQHAQC